jgi:hypothetical protein
VSATVPDSRLVRIVGAGAVGARLARAVLAGDLATELEIDDIRGDVAQQLIGALGERARPVGALGAGGSDPTVVVLAGPASHLELASAALAAGVSVVSVSDDLDDVRSLLSLERMARKQGATLVVGAAMSPGLSGLVARHLASRLDRFDEIHVAIHGTGGPACAMQHHQALGGTALGWQDRTWLERPAGSGRELAWFPEPIGAKDCYRAEMVDPLLLTRAFPDVDRVTARMSATRRDRLTARLPMLTPPHPEGGLGGLRVEVRGHRGLERVALVAGLAERTAIAAAHVAAVFTMAILQGELGAGLVLPGDAALDTERLLDRLTAAGLVLQEFVGTEARSSW